MTKIKTEYDSYTGKKLLINLVEDVFTIEDKEYGRIDGLKYAILTINGEEYITYSKVILKQLDTFGYEQIDVFVVLKAFYVKEFFNRKYHRLHVVPEELL